MANIYKFHNRRYNVIFTYLAYKGTHLDKVVFKFMGTNLWNRS